jgi:hypothetical protein
MKYNALILGYLLSASCASIECMEKLLLQNDDQPPAYTAGAPFVDVEIGTGSINKSPGVVGEPRPADIYEVKDGHKTTYQQVWEFYGIKPAQRYMSKSLLSRYIGHYNGCCCNEPREANQIDDPSSVAGAPKENDIYETDAEGNATTFGQVWKAYNIQQGLRWMSKAQIKQAMREKQRDTQCCVATSCLGVAGMIGGTIAAVILLPDALGNDDSSSNSYDAVAANMTQLLKLKME